MSVRKVRAKVLYDGSDTTLSDSVESISYTDNAEGSSDDITIVVDSKYDEGFFPEKEKLLDVTLYFDNWNSEGRTESYHCGTFTLDDITYSGPPNTLTVSGVAAPAKEAFQTVPKYQAWENTTLKQIAREKMDLYGMRTLFYNAPEISISNIEQNGETDSSFLKSMCDKYNLCLKIYMNDLVIFSWETYEKYFIPIAEYSAEDMESYRWNSTLNGTYTGAHLKYTVAATKKNQEKTIEVTVGEGPRLLELTDKVETEQEAIEIARQKVNKENMKAVTMSFTVMANPSIFASHKIRIKDSGRMNGDYMVTKVTHSISGNGGHTSTIECYKVMERI